MMGYTMHTFRREMDRRFGRVRRGRKRAARSAGQVAPRYNLNLAECTVHELLSCVRARIAEYETRGEQPLHITLIAEQMLCEGIGERRS